MPAELSLKLDVQLETQDTHTNISKLEAEKTYMTSQLKTTHAEVDLVKTRLYELQLNRPNMARKNRTIIRRLCTIPLIYVNLC